MPRDSHVSSAMEAPDVVASWRGWALAAEGADEPALAHRLWSTAPPEALPGWEAELGCVRTLLVLRRFPEALTRARSLATQVGHRPGDPVDLMLAAAFAAAGDDAAYDHLLRAARAPQLSLPAPQLLRVVGAVAEHRGRVQDAAWAWAVLVEHLGVTSPTVAAGFAATLIGARRPDDTADTLLSTVRRAHAALDRLDPHPSTDPTPVLAATARLTDRGDTAGARLLLRAQDVATPGIAALRPVLRVITPTRQMLVRGAAAGVLLALGIGALMLLRTGAGVRVGTGGIMALAVTAWGRSVPLPGLSRRESEVYRVLARGGPASGSGSPLTVGASALLREPAARPGPRRNTGLWGLGGMLGLVAGLVVAMQLTRPGAVLASPDGAASSSTPIVWGVLTLGTGAVGFAAFRAADRILQRRRSVRAAERRRAELAAQAAVCVCLAQPARLGDAAVEYVTRHLAPAEPGRHLAAALPGAQVRRCVATRTVWLAGPLGAGDRPLALNGATALR